MPKVDLQEEQVRKLPEVILQLPRFALRDLSRSGFSGLAPLRSVVYLLRICLGMNEVFRHIAPHGLARLLDTVLAPPPETSGESIVEGDELSERRLAKLARNRLGELLGERISEELYRTLSAVLQRLEPVLASSDDLLSRNLALVAETFELTPVEAKVLEFVVVKSLCDEIPGALDSVKSLHKVARTLSFALGVEASALASVLLPRGRLRQCGLLGEVSDTGSVPDLDDLTQPTRPLTSLFVTPLGSATEISRTLLREMAPPVTELDFSFLKLDGEILVGLLKGAVEQRKAGVNILIFGPPGCGKSEFTRSLSNRTGLTGYEVSASDGDGGEASRSDRLASLRLTQQLVPASQGGFVVLDEAEDIFPGESAAAVLSSGRRADSKAWMNRLLETNTWPTVWVSNRISQMDPAYLRRFQLVIPYPKPDLQARKQMVELTLGRFGLAEKTRESFAGERAITPALLNNVSSMLELVRPEVELAEPYITHSVKRYASAVGLTLAPEGSRSAFSYDTRWLNWRASLSLEETIGIAKSGCRLTMVLHGEPGTGKTSLARHIATCLDKHLVYRTTSNLISKWLGESEQNVRTLFETSSPEEEILFLDEADSLLRSRESASNRWEIAVTSEFLRCVEQYQGIFIAATNFIDVLDPALMRRFDVKAELLPLTRAQRRALLAEMSGGVPPEELGLRLDRLERLTLGDFVTAQRFQTQPIRAEQLVRNLEREYSYKPGANRSSMGFM